MKLKGKFKNLKTGAKRVFVGMLILCILSSATGIGSIFVQATEEDPLVEHSASTEWSYDDNSHWHGCTVEGCQEHKYDEGGHDYNHSLSYTPSSNGTHILMFDNIGNMVERTMQKIAFRNAQIS